MGKKNNSLGKFLAFATTTVAIGGACYVFREQIKESTIYKKASEKLGGLFNKFAKDDFDDDDFIFDDDNNFDDTYSEDLFSDSAKSNREYTSITINQRENSSDSTDDNEDEAVSDANQTDDAKASAETVADTSSDANEPTSNTEDAKQSNTSEDLSEIFMVNPTPTTQHVTSNDAPNVSNSAADTKKESDTYENEGLSDVSEETDVLEEQDKLDF